MSLKGKMILLETEDGDNLLPVSTAEAIKRNDSGLNVEESLKLKTGFVDYDDQFIEANTPGIEKLANDTNKEVIEARKGKTNLGERIDELPQIEEFTDELVEIMYPNLQNEVDTLKDENVSFKEKIDNINSQLETNANNIYYVSPKNFNDNIQNAIEYAFNNNISCVKLEGKKYTLTDSVLVYSQMTLDGIKGKTVLELKGVDKPVISKKGSIMGNTHIKNIKVIGDVSLVNNHGIVLNDFYSSIVDCEVTYCGGYGFYMFEGGASSTLVENRIENCISRYCYNTSFYLGSSTNKITDGFLVNCVSCGNGSSKALYIGSGAGWKIDGLHTYGHAGASDVVRVANSYHTFINNIYIEDFITSALNISQCQQSLNVSNITINFKNGLKDSKAIVLNHSTAHSYVTNVNISNVTINSYGGLTSCCVLGGDDSNYVASVTNVSITGDKSGLNLIQSGLSSTRYRLIANARILGTVDISRDLSEDTRSLLYSGYKIPYYKSGKIVAGNVERTLTIPLSPFYDYDKIIANFKIYTSAWDTGSARIKYSTELLLSAKTGTSAVAYNNTLFTPVGFTIEPTFTIDRTNKTLTIIFTPSATDGEGIWVCEMYQL